MRDALARDSTVSGGSVALIPTCAECEAYRLPADGGKRTSAAMSISMNPRKSFLLPACAEREFGRD